MSHAACSNPPRPAQTGIAGALPGAATLWRAWRRERAVAATVRMLRRLDDQTLRDIGLRRDNLAAGVRRRLGEGPF